MKKYLSYIKKILKLFYGNSTKQDIYFLNLFIISTLNLILSLPKTIIFNLKYFGIKGIFLFPVIVSYRTKFKTLRGEILFSNKMKPLQIIIGFGDTSVTDFSEKTFLNLNGTIRFNGSSRIGSGSYLSVGKNAVLTLGNNFKITGRSSISCFEDISFGDNCLLSWDILIMDTDAHGIYDFDNKLLNANKKIIVGNNVWIGCRNTILKGTIIGNDTIVAANSVLSKEYKKSNVLIAGNPAKIIKEYVLWKGDL